MALSFLRDRDENEVLGNLGAFAQAGGTGNSVQVLANDNVCFTRSIIHGAILA